MQDMSAFFSIRPDGTATEIHCIGNGALWELFSTDRDAYENVWRVWRSLRRRNFHALPEEKGVPVAGTGINGNNARRTRYKSVNGAGVSASSHVVSLWPDEGEKGRWVRKLVRRRERALWQRDWRDEGYDVEEASTVAQWFYDNSTDLDYDPDIIPSVYTVGETVVEWPNDYYDEYGYGYDYDPGPYNVYDYVDFDPYDFDGYADFCYHCGGPCEL